VSRVDLVASIEIMVTQRHKNFAANGNSFVRYLRAAFFKILIAATAFIHFVLINNRVHQWYVQHANTPIDWLPDSWMFVPFQLLFASVFLLLGRWWGNIIAFLISARLILQLGFGALEGISNAHSKQMFSRFVIEYWLRTKFEYQPQELFQLGLAFVIFSYAIFDSSRCLKRARSRRHP
jgi:hypothetical protein